MRTAINVIAILLLLNLLLAVGFVGWLWSSGRLDKDRVDRVVEMFEKTIEQEDAELEEARVQAEEAREAAQQALRIMQVSDGPQTMSDRLTQVQQVDQLTEHRLERMKEEAAALRKQMAIMQQLVTKQKKELEAQQASFEQQLKTQAGQAQDESFKDAVATIEQLKPKQAKAVFQKLMAVNQTDQVVEYLAAMQLRKRGSVLKEFKEDDEITQAAILIEELRLRGVEPFASSQRAGADGGNL